MTISVLRQLSAAVTTATDLLLVRTLVGAIFSVAQADSFISLSPESVIDVGPKPERKRVRVVLSHMKGEVRRE